jgi:hypothetical protein
VPFLKLGKPRFENGIDVTPSRVAMATLTCKVPLPSLEAQRALFMPGACPMSYDGVRGHEAGFQHYPEGVTGVGVATGGGALTNATYGICFLYEWEDAKGVVWRSAPSVPLSVALGANNALSCTLPHLRITDKQGNYTLADERRGAVRLVGFRTEANGSIYYRDVPTVGSAAENNPGALSAATWITELSDALLIKNELLPTTGGGLENEAFNSSTIACVHQRRIFTVMQEEASFVQYTDEIDERFLAPATNEVYRIPVPVDGGSVVGLASMDDKLVIFCQRRIYYVYGEGPNRLGQQNGYSLPQMCSASLGMLGGSHESLALTPDGIWFMSSAGGLRLLTRGLQVAMGLDEDGVKSYLGRETDGHFTAAFTSIRAHSITSRNQVRWYVSTDSDGFVVVWDYQNQQWSKFTNFVANGGSVSARDAFWHCNGTTLFKSQTVGGYDLPFAGTNSVLFETAWLSLTGFSGYQRVYAVQFLMNALASVSVQVEVAYDGSATYAAAVTHNAGVVDPLEIRVDLVRQKCSRVRFRVTIPTDGAENVRLAAMSLLIGVKSGLNRLPAAKRF